MNADEVKFPAPTGDWGKVNGVAIHEQPTDSGVSVQDLIFRDMDGDPGDYSYPRGIPQRRMLQVRPKMLTNVVRAMYGTSVLPVVAVVYGAKRPCEFGVFHPGQGGYR